MTTMIMFTINIDPACRGELAFGVVETENGDKGWCHGKMGCADFCSTALVYTLGDTSYVAERNQFW